MGIILCKKHGRQGFREVCSHINNEYERGIYNEHRDFSLGEFFGILVCDECWKTHNLDNFKHFAEVSFDEFLDLDEAISKPMEDEWSKIYDSVNRRPWCLQCVTEIYVKQARRNGESIDFPVYEKTLTIKDKDKIAEIENQLISELKLRKYGFTIQLHYKNENCLIGHKDLPSVYVHAGVFTSPLLVSVHSVLSEVQQNEIIEFVKRIFEQEEKNQVKIEFHDEDEWIINENFEQILHYKGKQGEILREVFLNCGD